jgi:hypothetical protein
MSRPERQWRSNQVAGKRARQRSHAIRLSADLEYTNSFVHCQEAEEIVKTVIGTKKEL